MTEALPPRGFVGKLSIGSSLARLKEHAARAAIVSFALAARVSCHSSDDPSR